MWNHKEYAEDKRRRKTENIGNFSKIGVFENKKDRIFQKQNWIL